MSESLSHTPEGRATATALSLEAYGLNRFWKEAAPETDGPVLGRVVSRQAQRYEIATAAGRRWAEVSGRLSYTALDETELPVVGDWVKAWWDGPGGLGLILEVCPRVGELRRLAPGGSGACQVLAANMQHLVVLWPLDRVETEKAAHRPDGFLTYVRWGMVQRFVTMARSGGVAPILVLSKADLLAPELQEDVRAQAWRRWPGLPVLAIGEADRGLDRTDALLDLLEPASTAVLVGLSGAGKSTLLNRLDSGAGARTQAISDAVGKGRHTTTHRELYALPSGALLIDSPGIRELGVWAESGGLDEGFGQLSELAAGCRFADCRHEGEPGCAVREAIAAGSLEADDLEQYRKQQAELAWLATRQVKAAVKAARAGGGERLSEREHYEATADERRWKQIAKFQKQRQKGGG